MNAKQAASYSSPNYDHGAKLYTGDRLTKDELELVIEKHKAGLLVKGGEVHVSEGLVIYHRYCGNSQGCIMQHVNHDPFPSSAWKANKAVAAWFDDNYKPSWADWMLREAMIKAGLVEE